VPQVAFAARTAWLPGREALALVSLWSIITSLAGAQVQMRLTAQNPSPPAPFVAPFILRPGTSAFPSVAGAGFGGGASHIGRASSAAGLGHRQTLAQTISRSSATNK
jgi:hypothetical protein